MQTTETLAFCGSAFYLIITAWVTKQVTTPATSLLMGSQESRWMDLVPRHTGSVPLDGDSKSSEDAVLEGLVWKRVNTSGCHKKKDLLSGNLSHSSCVSRFLKEGPVCDCLTGSMSPSKLAACDFMVDKFSFCVPELSQSLRPVHKRPENKAQVVPGKTRDQFRL